MYKIGDKVIHKREGACYITELTQMELNNISKEYYVLEPLVDKKASIYISVDQKNQGHIRPAITQVQMKEYEAAVDSMNPDWIEDAKVRHKKYIETLSSFEFLEVFSVLKYLTVRNTKKPLCAKDEQLLLTAQKLIYSEISIVLNEEYSIVADKVKEFLCT